MFGSLGWFELEVAVRVAGSHCAEDGPDVGVPERRDAGAEGIGKHAEVTEALRERRHLDAGDREQLAAQIERIERRRVVSDDVVLRRDREVDPGRDQGEHPVLGCHRRVEARSRMDVQVAREHAGGWHDVTGGERCLGHVPRGDVDDLGIDRPLDSLGGCDAVPPGRQRRRHVAAKRVDDGPSARGAEVGTEAGVDRPVDATHEKARGQRRAGVGVDDGHVQLAARRHVEHEIAVCSGDERIEAAGAARVHGGVPLDDRARDIDRELSGRARAKTHPGDPLRVSPDDQRPALAAGHAAVHGGRREPRQLGEGAPHRRAGPAQHDVQAREAPRGPRGQLGLDGGGDRDVRRLHRDQPLLRENLDGEGKAGRRERHGADVRFHQERRAGECRAVGDRAEARDEHDLAVARQVCAQGNGVRREHSPR